MACSSRVSSSRGELYCGDVPGCRGVGRPRHAPARRGAWRVEPERSGAGAAVVAVVGGGLRIPVHGAWVRIRTLAEVVRILGQANVERVVATTLGGGVTCRGISVRDRAIVTGVVGDPEHDGLRERQLQRTETKRNVVGQPSETRTQLAVEPVTGFAADALGVVRRRSEGNREGLGDRNDLRTRKPRARAVRLGARVSGRRLVNVERDWLIELGPRRGRAVVRTPRPGLACP